MPSECEETNVIANSPRIIDRIHIWYLHQPLALIPEGRHLLQTEAALFFLLNMYSDSSKPLNVESNVQWLQTGFFGAL
jgi:hypothetical protein